MLLCTKLQPHTKSGTLQLQLRHIDIDNLRCRGSNEVENADGAAPKCKWLQELSLSGSLLDGPIKNDNVNKGQSGGQITVRVAECKNILCVGPWPAQIESVHNIVSMYDLIKKKLTALTSTLRRSVSDAQVRSRSIMQKNEGAWAADV